MDIKQAIEKVSRLEGEIERCEKFLASSMENSAQVRIQTQSLNDIDIKAQIGAEGLRKLVGEKIEKMNTERAKLTSVIDMANAALKGLMT
ncbi:MAG: hypothetical protein H5U29_00065 [Pusillimonas sp.]|nr:hypothetical protein [Pusillimonas sp.]